MRAVKEYCCCAIPISNAGIYTTLVVNFCLGIIAGTLSIGTPSIVGAATPGFTSWVLAILCYVASVVQVAGIIAVLKEKTILYRRYTTMHCGIVIAIFAVAAVWIGWSGGKHSAATSDCLKDFFPNSDSSSGPLNASQEGQILCNIFAWVTFGVMIGLWLVLGIFEIYLYLVISSYGSIQRDDHSTYFSTYSVNDGARPNDVLMGDRSGARGDAWDSRMSMDSVDMVPLNPKGHNPSDSTSTVRDEKSYRDEPEGLPSSNYQPPYRSNTVLSRAPRTMSPDRGYSATSPERGYPSYPLNAHTEEPGPTPAYNNAYYSNSSHAPYPQSQPHPAEGSFGRKTPRSGAGPETSAPYNSYA